MTKKSTVNEVYEYYINNPITKKAACERYNRSDSYLTTYIKRNNLPDKDKSEKRRTAPHSNSLDTKAYKLYLAGATPKEILAQTTRTIHSVKRYAERNGLPKVIAPPSLNNKKEKQNPKLTAKALEWKIANNRSYVEAAEYFDLPATTIKGYHYYQQKKRGAQKNDNGKKGN
jgi:hypothetical protein